MQENINGTPPGSGFFKGVALVASFATVLGIATPMVRDLEGRSIIAYLDTGGVPTICNGETKGVQLGQTKTDKECDDLLKGSLGAAIKHVDKRATVPLSVWQRAGLGSFVYNVGPGAFDRSTVLKNLNAGKIQQACDGLLQWVYVKGKDCRVRSNNCLGLVRRRNAEREYCLKTQ